MVISELTESDRQFWQENGYFVSDLIIDGSVLAQLREHSAMVFRGEYTNEPPAFVNWKPGSPPDKIRQMAFSWRVDPVLRAAALTPEIGAIAAQLVQSDTIRLLMDWLVHKPGVGMKADPKTGVGWHQDQHYWRSTTPANLITARIPMDDETEENGCMTVIPGSHKLGLTDGFKNGFWNAGRTALPANLNRDHSLDLSPFSIELRMGQIMFHHCLLLHSTGQNRTDRPRRSLNIHMMPGGTKFKGSAESSFFGDYARQHGQHFSDGMELEGNIFPVIYSSNTTLATKGEG